MMLMEGKGNEKELILYQYTKNRRFWWRNKLNYAKFTEAR